MTARNPQPGHPLTHHVAGARQNAPRTEIRLGARRSGSADPCQLPGRRTHPDDLTPARFLATHDRAGQPGLQVVRPRGAP